jgi:hypothetical protein
MVYGSLEVLTVQSRSTHGPWVLTVDDCHLTRNSIKSQCCVRNLEVILDESSVSISRDDKEQENSVLTIIVFPVSGQYRSGFVSIERPSLQHPLVVGPWVQLSCVLTGSLRGAMFDIPLLFLRSSETVCDTLFLFQRSRETVCFHSPDVAAASKTKDNRNTSIMIALMEE